MRRLTDQDGQKLRRIVRRGSTSSVCYRRDDAAGVGWWEPGAGVVQLVQADEDTVRDVIHRFNEIGLACLDLRWAGGRPRLLNRDDEDFVIQTATTRPVKLGHGARQRSPMRRGIAEANGSSCVRTRLRDACGNLRRRGADVTMATTSVQ